MFSTSISATFVSPPLHLSVRRRSFSADGWLARGLAPFNFTVYRVVSFVFIKSFKHIRCVVTPRAIGSCVSTANVRVAAIIREC